MYKCFRSKNLRLTTPTARELMKLTKKRKAVLDQIFSPCKDEYHKEKMNIIGAYLGRGIQEQRLPGEIFLRAKQLFMTKKNTAITEEEKEIILKYLENHPEDKQPWSSLSRMLGRPGNSICWHHQVILRHKGKLSKKGPFTTDENREILQTVSMKHKSFLGNDSPGRADAVWDELGEKLGRTPYSVYQHWILVIHSHLTMLENGVQDVDFRERLVKYFVDNGILYPQDVDWGKISRYLF